MFKHCLISTLKQIFELKVEDDVCLCLDVHSGNKVRCKIFSSLFNDNDDDGHQQHTLNNNAHK